MTGILEQPQRAHDVIMTSYQRRCGVMTSHRRLSDVIMTSCACWDSSGNLSRKEGYKGLKGKTRIPTDDLIPKTIGVVEIVTPWHLSYHLLVKRFINVVSFPDSLFSTAEMSDDCVSKIASLMRSSVYFSPIRTPW